MSTSISIWETKDGAGLRTYRLFIAPKAAFESLHITHEDCNDKLLMSRMLASMAKCSAVADDDVCDRQSRFSTCKVSIRNADVALSAVHEPSVETWIGFL